MKKTFFALSLGFILLSATITSCKDDTTDPGPTTSTTEIISKKATTAPALDGTIDASWADCSTLIGTATVPNLANDFKYFVGEAYSFKMRSMYDATNIYFLIEYADPTKSVDRQSWYFDAAAKLWKQHNKKPTTATDKYYEDKFAFLWPTASSPAAWQSTTCYNTCHAVPAGKGFDTENKHFTNSASEVAYQWHYKLVRTGPGNQLDDQMQIYIDPNNPLAAGPNGDQMKEGGRSSDPKPGTGGVADNKQTLNNGTANVSVPKYVIPGKTGYSVITKTEIDAGTAKLITAVDANGVLTYAGGTIDPTDAGYVPATGAKRFPSIIFNGALDGSRGDVMTFANHTGTGWVIEIKRALKTTDLINDIQFDVSKEVMFGFAIFENSAVAHGITPGLKLKFEQ